MLLEVATVDSGPRPALLDDSPVHPSHPRLSAENLPPVPWRGVPSISSVSAWRRLSALVLAGAAAALAVQLRLSSACLRMDSNSGPRG